MAAKKERLFIQYPEDESGEFRYAPSWRELKAALNDWCDEQAGKLRDENHLGDVPLPVVRRELLSDEELMVRQAY
jgi:hypothetical protein